MKRTRSKALIGFAAASLLAIARCNPGVVPW